jgi:hypothetical protein
MDRLHKEVKKLTTNVNKMLFCEALLKNLCLHFFGSVCCVAGATRLNLLRMVDNYKANRSDKEKNLPGLFFIVI